MRRTTPSTLPPLRIGIYGVGGKLVRSFTMPDPRLGVCECFNSRVPDALAVPIDGEPRDSLRPTLAEFYQANIKPELVQDAGPFDLMRHARLVACEVALSSLAEWNDGCPLMGELSDDDLMAFAGWLRETRRRRKSFVSWCFKAARFLVRRAKGGVR